MILLKKINKIEVKRSFIIADRLKLHTAGKKENLTSRIHRFKSHIKHVKQEVGRMSEKSLDKIIASKSKRRLIKYNNMDWYLGEVTINEVGVWKGAGGLPIPWTRGTLRETSERVARALKKHEKGMHRRSHYAIPGIIRFKDAIISEPYLYPITLPRGMAGRRGLKYTKGEIDDGCMRSIAFAISGEKTLKVYIGKRKKIRKKKIKSKSYVRR